MRIFTLGKKGIPLFFFALFLISGTYSYGQEPTCPGVTDQNPNIAGNQQYFCDSEEAELTALLIEGENIIYYTDDTYSSTLPSTTLLVGGLTYYVEVGNCRTSIEVTVYNEPEILGIEESATRQNQANNKQSTGLGAIVICVSSETDPEVYVSDLRTSAPEESVVWFYSLTLTGEPMRIENPETTELIDDAYYYAAQENLYTEGRDENFDGCISNTSMVRVRLNSEAAPTGPTTQNFCAIDNPTLSDIEASGDNRFYATAETGVELSRNTALIDGRTYYVSSLGELCESIARLAVTVAVSPPTDFETPEPGIVCETDVQATFPDFPAIRNFYLNLLDPNISRDGTFSPTAEQISGMYQADADGLGDFTTTYTFGTGACDQVDLTLRIVPSETATVAPIEGDTVCASEDGLDLSAYLTGNTQGGTFTSENGVITNGMLDISAEGTYAITYTVQENDPTTCLTGMDSEDFTITVGQNNSIPVDTLEVALCEAQVEGFLANPETAVAYFSSILAENGITDFSGTFDQSLEAIYALWMQDPIGTFETTYTVGEEGCQDSVDISITVTEGSSVATPEPGIVCETDVQATFPDFVSIRNFYRNLLPPSISRDGTFSPTAEQISAQYQADADGLGDFTTTYTFGPGVCDQVELTFTIVPAEQATVEPIENDAVCAAEEALDLSAYLTGNTPGGTFTSENGAITNGMLDVSTEGTYTITYTVAESDEATCLTGTASTEFTVTVGQNNSIPVENINISLCEAQVEGFLANPETAVAYFRSILAENGITDFSGSFDQSLEAIYALWIQDPIGTFETTYTVGEAGCQDSVDISITVTEGSSVATPEPGIVCETDVQATFPDFVSIRNFYRNLLDPSIPRTGTFSPTAEQIAAQYQADADGLGDFTTTYTFGPGVCDQVELTFTIVPTEQATVEPIENDAVCTAEEALDLSDYLTGNTPGGTFTSENGVITNGMLDVSTEGTYTITYTVNESDVATCLTGTASTTFIVDVTGEESQAVVEDISNFPTCLGASTITLSTLLVGDTTMGGTFTVDGEAATTFDPSMGVGTYEVIYTVDGDELPCVTGEASDSFMITVTNEESEAVVEDIASFSICSEENMITLSTLLVGDTTLGGTFTVDGEPATTFNPSMGEGTYEVVYTVNGDELACVTGEASDSFVITVGENNSIPVDTLEVALCEAQVEGFLENPETAVAYFRSILAENGITDFSGSFDQSLEAIYALWMQDPIGTFETTYTVGEAGCQDSVDISITVTEGSSVATPEPGIVCETDVQATFPDFVSIRNFYRNLLDPSVPRTGTFSPTAEQISAQYQADADGLGDFTTTYTFGPGVCDQVELTFTIVPAEQATVEPIENDAVCTAEEALDLSDYLTGNTPGGTFTSENGVITNAMLDISAEGTYTITYTVNESDEATCLTGTASTEFTVTVSEDAYAGEDNSIEVCNDEIQAGLFQGSVDLLRSYYLNLLDEGVSREGTFTTNLQDLIDRYDSGDEIGAFVATYIVSNGECEDSVDLTLMILPNPDAGQSATVNPEEGATETVDLFGRLGGTPEEGGVWTFENEEVDGTFDPATDEEGAYTYTVTSDNGCSASAIVTVVIGTQEPNCPEITETEQVFCDGTPTVANLMPEGVLWYSSADAEDALDATTTLVDGELYYAGDVEGTCDNRPSVTAIVSSTPDAPTVAAFDGCVVEGATVADLNITVEDGNTFEVFMSEAMENPVDSTMELVEGTYYVAQTNTAGCVSDLATITVTLGDVDAPSLVTEPEELCANDGLMIADLEGTVVQNGDLLWYTTATGTETVPESTVLQNGTTYYAAAVDATSGCESSVRTRVDVTLAMCEIDIPEIFTPNGDDINDTFVIDRLPAQYPDFEILVYNRWGEPVYEGNAGTPNWDGYSHKGSFGDGVLPTGVYFYILYYNDGETAPTQGKVYLSR